MTKIRPFKLSLTEEISINKILELGFKPGDNFKLVKKVYTADKDDNKNFYSIDLITSELYVSLQSEYFDDTIYDLINLGIIQKTNINATE